MIFYCIFFKKKRRQNKLRRKKIENADCNKNVQTIKYCFENVVY